jgi:FkbM family methyltransferase
VEAETRFRSFDSPAELREFYAGVRAANGGSWPDFEELVEAIYTAILTGGDAAVDGGAFAGRHTFPMARLVGSTGRVLAFEPIHKLAWVLETTVRARYPAYQSVIRILDTALGEKPAEADFLVAEEMGYSGLKPRKYPRPGMAVGKRTVKVDTLDNLCAGEERVRFIKLDLEGGEYHALAGGKGLLARTRPVVVLEYDHSHAPSFYDFAHEDFLDLLEELDYELLDVLGVRFDKRCLWEAAKVWNFVALPREQALEGRVVEAIRGVTG